MASSAALNSTQFIARQCYLPSLLPHCRPDQVSLVFTPAFLRCLATNLKKGNSYLHAGAKKCAERIGGYCERTPGELKGLCRRCSLCLCAYYRLGLVRKGRMCGADTASTTIALKMAGHHPNCRVSCRGAHCSGTGAAATWRR